MDRRTAIKNTALLMGGTLAASSILGVMNGCKADPANRFNPVFLKSKEASILEALVDGIIPPTETPGAAEAGVPAFIDTMMAEYYPEKERQIFRDGLAKLDEDAKSKFNLSFVKLEASQREALLSEYDKRAYMNNNGESDFFRMTKELTLLGYFTSEDGATKALYFDPVPENYQGCIDFGLVGRTWAM